MASILSVNENNDIFATSSGSLAISTGIQAVLEACQHVVEVRRGGMIYAQTDGIDYFNQVFAGSPNLLVFESQARTAISSVEDVETILEFNAELDGNTLEYSASILTSFGVGEISGAI
jgi:hypothetical protein